MTPQTCLGDFGAYAVQSLRRRKGLKQPLSKALRFGISNDPTALPELVQLYNRFFLQAPADRRRQIYGHVAMIVPQLGGWTAGAITPFMLLDPDLGIVSTATVDYTSLWHSARQRPYDTSEGRRQNDQTMFQRTPRRLLVD